MRINLEQLKIVALLGAVFGFAACTQAPALNASDLYESSSYYGYGDFSSNGQIALNSSSTQIGVGQTMQFYTSNGVQPLVYTLDGVGSIDTDSGLFYAGTAPGLATITVRDIQGRQAKAQVYVSGTSGGSYTGSLGTPTASAKPALTVIATAFDGSVAVPSGSQVGCPAGTSIVGTVANPLGSPPKYYGSRWVCAARANVTTGSQVYADISVTAPGLRGAAACPTGYTRLGSVMDCSNNNCSGEQLICGKIAAAGSVSQYITNFYVSRAGAHAAAGAGCSDNSIAFGSTVDCGGGYCSGFQTFCKSF